MAGDQSVLRGGLLVTLLGGALSIAAVFLQYWLRSDDPRGTEQRPISVQAGDATSNEIGDTPPPAEAVAAGQPGGDSAEHAALNTDEEDRPREKQIAPTKLSDRQLQENCLNRGRLASMRGGKPLVVVVVRPDGTGSEAKSGPQSDLIRGRLAELIAPHQRTAATDALKPWFYSSGLFDQVWAGESEILGRLGLLGDARQSVLLAKAELAPARQTDFAGIVYVEGTLALRLLTSRGAKGPVTVSTSGSGGSAAQAALKCARRLTDSVDLTTLFAEES